MPTVQKPVLLALLRSMKANLDTRHTLIAIMMVWRASSGPEAKGLRPAGLERNDPQQGYRCPVVRVAGHYI